MPDSHNHFSYDPARSVIWHLTTSRKIEIIKTSIIPDTLPEDKSVLVGSIEETHYIFQADKEIPLTFIHDAAQWYAAHVKSGDLVIQNAGR